MNSILKKILSLAIAGLMIYLLIWPFINSAISHNYYIRAVTDGSPGRSYTAEFGDGYINVNIAHYNNIATQEENPKENEEYSNNLDPDTFEKLEKVTNSFKGFHIFPRRHNGYGFYYDGLADSNFFYTADEKANILKFAQILEKIARGSERYPEKRGFTYEKIGQKELDDFIKELDLEE